MTTNLIKRIDQRLDQHADATGIILKRLDEIIANAHILARRHELIEARLKKLESIVLPDPDNRHSARPSQMPT